MSKKNIFYSGNMFLQSNNKIVYNKITIYIIIFEVEMKSLHNLCSVIYMSETWLHTNNVSLCHINNLHHSFSIRIEQTFIQLYYGKRFLYGISRC